MKDFDQKEMERLRKTFKLADVYRATLSPRSQRYTGSESASLGIYSDTRKEEILWADNRAKEIEQFILDSYARRDAMMREELLGRMPKDKNIASGEGLPFENSPEIYGNERMVAYARGYNEGKAEITSIITNLLS